MQLSLLAVVQREDESALHVGQNVMYVIKMPLPLLLLCCRERTNIYHMLHIHLYSPNSECAKTSSVDDLEDKMSTFFYTYQRSVRDVKDALNETAYGMCLFLLISIYNCHFYYFKPIDILNYYY